MLPVPGSQPYSACAWLLIFNNGRKLKAYQWGQRIQNF